VRSRVRGLEAAEVLCFCRPVGGHSSVWREILEDRTDRLGSFLWNELIEADEMNEMAVFCAFSGCFGLIETNRLTVDGNGEQKTPRLGVSLSRP